MSKPSILVIGLVALIVLAIAIDRVVAFKVNEITYPVTAHGYILTDEMGHPLTQVAFTTSDNLTLSGWYLKPQNGVTIIVQHGWKATSQTMVAIGLMLHRHGYGVLLFDFRGHGNSQDAQVTLGLTEVNDTNAAVAFLLAQPETKKIGLVGISMGAATGILAAAENKHIQAIVAEASFAELKDEVGIGIERQTPLPGWPLDELFVLLAQRQTGRNLQSVAPIRAIGKISPRQVLLLQGGKDKSVLSDSGEKLFAAAGEPKEIWRDPLPAHGLFFKTMPEAYEQHVIAFFDKLL